MEKVKQMENEVKNLQNKFDGELISKDASNMLSQVSTTFS